MTLPRFTTTAAATLLAAAIAAPAHAQRPPRQPRPPRQQQPQAGPGATTATPPPGQPQAAPDATTAEARRAYDDGRRELDAGQNEAALAHFQHAYELHPNPVVLLPIGEAQQRLGRIGDAIATFERYLHDRADAPDRAAIEARVADLRRRPATLHVESTPPGARIVVDGHDTGQTTPADVPAQPGHHAVRLELADHAPASQETDATPGGRAELTATLAATATPAATTPAVAATSTAPSAAAPSAAPTTPPPPRGTSPAVWVAGGLAGAGLIAGSVFGFLALGDLADYNRMPTVETRDRGETMALLSDISFGVAVLSASVAVVVFLSDRAPPENRARARALLRPAGAPARLRAVPNGLVVTF